eukprot:m.239060 g.239060  ORF g.239060 m.239060 type:complete len:657 (-) comp13934_c0_seq2:150-2120(-)
MHTEISELLTSTVEEVLRQIRAPRDVGVFDGSWFRDNEECQACSVFSAGVSRKELKSDKWISTFPVSGTTSKPFVQVAPTTPPQAVPRDNGVFSRKMLKEIRRVHTSASNSQNPFATKWCNEIALEYSKPIGMIVDNCGQYLQTRSSMRKRAGFTSGKSINPPKLMQCKATKFTSTNYWERYIPEGRPSYRFAIAIDTSASTSYSSVSYFNAVAMVVMLEAFEKFGLSDSIVYAFGKRCCMLLKDRTQSFDAACQSATIEYLASTNFLDNESNVSAAVVAGVDLLEEANEEEAVSESTLFVLTDDCHDKQFPEAQQYAVGKNVAVVQIVMGSEPTSIHRGFDRFIEAETPFDLPRGLAMYFERMNTPVASKANNVPVRDFSVDDGKEKELVKRGQAWVSKGSPYAEYVGLVTDDDKVEVELSVQRGHGATVCVDFVIVMDCTGSMRKFLEMAKKHSIDIARRVKETATQQMGMEAKVRMGFVGYRDYNSTDVLVTSRMYEPHEFEDMVAEIGRTTAGGGGDAEELFTGLQAALDLRWTDNPMAMKTILVVADAAQHGDPYVNANEDSYHSGPPRDRPDHGMTHEQRGQRIFAELRKRDINMIFTQIRSRTRQMEQVFKTEAYLGDKFKTIKLGQNDAAVFADKVHDQLVMVLSELG